LWEQKEYTVRLVSRDGPSFELAILGYEFPELEEADYDSNWLVVRIDVTTPEGSWTATEPSLLTYDVKRLADWLDDVKNNQQMVDEIGFIEPLLWFKVLGGPFKGKNLRVYFGIEYRPPWARSRPAYEGEIWPEFPLSEIDLNAAAQSLREQLSRFPQRAER
jgi:hypothetical protein